MLQEVFYWVFNMSIAAVITGVIVMLIRLVNRIENILSFKKITWISLIVFLTLITAIFYVLLTNAK